MKNKIVMIALFSFALSGCGSSDSTNEKKNSQNTNTPGNSTTGNSNPDNVTDTPIEPWQKIVSVAQTFTCAITADEALKCWGKNTNGTLALGDADTSTEKLTPAATLLTSKVKSVSVSNTGGCANVDGAAMCWGDNSKGQLGNATAATDTAFSATPVKVKGLDSKVTSISSGSTFACAVVNGGAKCWGDNSNGALGNSGTDDSNEPVDVTGLTEKVKFIAAGTDHACALTEDGIVSCWGKNDSGQIGDPTAATANSNIPVAVTFADSAKAIQITSSNGYSCATLESGKINCWGKNSKDYGQLGNNPAEDPDASNPKTGVVEVSGITAGATRVTLAGTTACAIVNGSLNCWGNNANGQIGDLTATTSKTPVAAKIVAGKQIKDMATANGTTCVMMPGNQLACWGMNSSGQLGNNTIINSPKALVSPTGF